MPYIYVDDGIEVTYCYRCGEKREEAELDALEAAECDVDLEPSLLRCHAMAEDEAPAKCADCGRVTYPNEEG